jgi:hypothetical protein
MLLRKPCQPGIPGCVLYRKVRFIAEVEREMATRAPGMQTKVRRVKGRRRKP